MPLNTDRADPPDGTGAGAAKVSAGAWFVGWNVPDVSAPRSDSGDAAASSNTSVTLVMSVLPPASDIMMAFAPVGPTSSTSTSSGNVWLRLLSVTVTFEIVPAKPETPMLDGYGETVVSDAIAILVALQNSVSGVSSGQFALLIVTVKEHCEPVALVQVTVVVPTKKNEPEGGEHSTVPHTPVVVGAGYVTEAAPH